MCIKTGVTDSSGNRILRSFMIFLVLILIGQAGSLLSQSTPPEYRTFRRSQRIDYSPEEDELLRIWVVYVDQGDGLLIQLPTRYNYDPNPDDNDGSASERIDILIDGGSDTRREAQRMNAFLASMYGPSRPIIEYGIITHHDQDHILGLTHILEIGDAPFRTICHNGLASYMPGHRNFGTTTLPDRPAVFIYRDSEIKRGMAFLYGQDSPHAGRIDNAYLIGDISGLRNSHTAGELHGIYNDLAEAILDHAETDERLRFPRVYRGAPFIEANAIGDAVDLTGIRFECLWPQEYLRPYGGSSNRPGWGETINGNSVVFRLVYGDFEMLFTGDMNELSEEAMLEHLQSRNESNLLECDVLKVPHHGSSHALKEFYDCCGPVLSVASMGDKGFQSKAMNRRNWQHPDTDVIRWLGGAHRFYSTFIHEKRFKWSDITTEEERQEMIERKHILIETDGEWFRVVELPLDHSDPGNPPTVRETRRSNGTRWVRASD